MLKTGKQDGIFIITGANSGIGYEAAKAVLAEGVHVIMACRDEKKALAAMDKIRNNDPEASMEFIHLDLADLKSVKTFSEQFLRKYDRLDVLINNAGVMATPFGKTKDGFEMQFGTNHLGHFALTALLWDRLEKTVSSRVVTVSSIAHFNGIIHLDDLEADSWYTPMKAYRQSKLANLLFAYELQRRLTEKNSSTISVSVHPGITATNIVKLPFPINHLKDLVLVNASKGARPTVMGAMNSGLKGGEFIGPTGFRQAFGKAGILRSGDHSYDKKLWLRLWEVSEQMTGIKFKL